MSLPDLVIRGRRVIVPEGERPAAIHVRAGTIVALTEPEDVPPASRVIDAGDLVVLPGLVDTHVHVNEPGRTEWEGFETATRAAAAGGVTTLVDMPLNSIPATTTADALATKAGAAKGRCFIDCGFWGGLVPGNTADLGPLVEAGVHGFKAFLVPSGVDEFRNAGEADLRAGLPILAATGVPLLVHAELALPAEALPLPPGEGRGEGESTSPSASTSDGGDPRRYATWLASRPRAWEQAAIELMIRLAGESGARVHIVHLASGDALPAIAAARATGLPLTVETCPHYLRFASEDVPDGGTEWKCAPPIRERANRERLWTALREGLIDLVASDHSPCPPPMKQKHTGDFMRAWGGIASLELGLAVVWTGARERGFGLVDVVRWMSGNPARLAGLERTKGAIAPGRDADLVLFAPDASFAVEPEALRQRHKLTPYAGETLRGVVEATYVRGTAVYERAGGGGGEFPAGPAGKLLFRSVGPS